MNNFIFKSPKRLIKNSSIPLERMVSILLNEQKCQRADLQTISRKIDRLLIDKHLQMQVDNYFDEDDKNIIPEEKQDLD